MKKLQLNKVTIANLTKNQLIDVKGGGYLITDVCGYSNQQGCSNIGCYNGTLYDTCSNQINCTAGSECTYSVHPV